MLVAPSAAREIVEWARARGAIVVSDECYIELGWDVEPVSVLHPSVCGTSMTASWRSTRCRSGPTWPATGSASSPATRALVADLLAVRKHIGMMVPAPVQAAAIAAFDDDAHVDEQREVYRAPARRPARRPRAGGIPRSTTVRPGLYLWATRGEPCWDTVRWFAERGIVVTPGDFYGPAGAQHVRVALTGTDEASRRPPPPALSRSDVRHVEVTLGPERHAGAGGYAPPKEVAVSEIVLNYPEGELPLAEVPATVGESGINIARAAQARPVE